MLPYTPIHPPNQARKGTSFGGYVEYDLSIPENQAAILAGKYIPIDWCYTGVYDDPQVGDVRYNFLPPATSFSLSLSCNMDGVANLYETCAEILVYAYKVEPPISSDSNPKTMEATNDYVAAAWYWGRDPEFLQIIQPFERWVANVTTFDEAAVTITGPASYWGVLVRPGIVSMANAPNFIIRARADLGVSTYPNGGNIRVNQPYCVPPFLACGNYPGTYIFKDALVSPRPRKQNAAALRHFEARFIRMFSSDALHTFDAKIWGGPWKIGAVAGVTDEEDPPSITLAIEDQSHTPEFAVDSGAFLSPSVVSVSGSAARATVDFIAHPVVKITGEDIASTDVAAGIYLEGAI